MADVSIILYHYSDNPIVANKTLTGGVTKTGAFRATTDVLRPTFRVTADSDSALFNYCYIADFGRYYFITAKRYVTSDLLEYSLYVDVRTSFQLELKGNKGVVERNTDNYNMYLQDPRIPVGAHKTMNVYTFSDTPFLGGANNRVIMLVLGGG